MENRNGIVAKVKLFAAQYTRSKIFLFVFSFVFWFFKVKSNHSDVLITLGHEMKFAMVGKISNQT